MKNVAQKLMQVQKDLKAPKGQFNKFGNYKYRSCEDILEAAKPLCVDNGLLLTVTDKIVLIGDRYYVEATASVMDAETAITFEVTASAREEESKKGMDGSQVTGAASSYARKYALNGLFCIDDTKDSDATNTHGKEEKQTPAPKQEWKDSLDIPKEWKDKVIEAEYITEAQVKRLYAIGKSKTDKAKDVLAKHGFGSAKAVTKDKYEEICKEIEMEAP